jgi:nucleotide-binding universal stress UspA family protein
MKKAILATDLSRPSELLMEFLPYYKTLGIEHITLFHVPHISFNHMEYSGYSIRVHLEASMMNLSNKINEAGFTSDFVFREGHPSQEIVDFASVQPSSLIIIASKGHGFAKRNLIGSTTLRVIQQSINPVLMIRVKCTGKDEKGEYVCDLESRKLLKSGLLLTDFSKNAAKAFEYAEEHLVKHFKKLGLMHVNDKVILESHDRKAIEKFNKQDHDRLIKCTVSLRQKTDAQVRCVLTEGNVVPEIMREVKLNLVSLIVLGTHGRAHFTDMVLGSTANAIIQLVDTNCLLVPMSMENE